MARRRTHFKNGKMFPISDTAMRRLACKVADKGSPYTASGRVSAIWCAETGVPRDLAEAALAHTLKDNTEAAYNRTALVKQRRQVMERWWAHVYGEVLSIEGAAA
jgi:integrase